MPASMDETFLIRLLLAGRDEILMQSAKDVQCWQQLRSTESSSRLFMSSITRSSEGELIG